MPVCAAPVPRGAVALADGVVVDAGPADALARRHPGVAVEDLGEALLLPGFVDAHTHLEWSLVGGLVPEADGFGAWLAGFLALVPRMPPGFHAAAATAGAVRALLAGTTTLLDSGPTGAGVAALAATGQRGTVHLEAFGADPAGAGDRARVVVAAMEELAAGAPPRVAVGVSPHAPYSAGAALWGALDRLLPSGTAWATHLAESRDESAALDDPDGVIGRALGTLGARVATWPGPGGAVARLHAAGVLRPGLVAAHCVHVTAADAALLAAADVRVAHCPISNGRLVCGRAPLETLRAAGVRVGLGTDSPASAGAYDLRAEARACAVVHGAAGVPPSPADLVRLMTLDGADAVGRPDLGRIAPGARADLVAVRPAPDALPGDPHAAALDPRSVVTDVWVDGERLVRDGRPARVDVEAVLTASAEARATLC